MHKVKLTLSAVALLGTVSLAGAAGLTGTIKSIDASAKTVTLDNGQTFKLGTAIQASNFKVGEKVKVTYSGSGANMMASTLQPAS